MRGDLVQSLNNDSGTKPKDKYSLWNGGMAGTHANKRAGQSKQTWTWDMEDGSTLGNSDCGPFRGE